MTNKLKLDMGLAFDAKDGQPFSIFHKDLTRGFMADGKTHDQRFWGRSIHDPRLYVEFDRFGKALEMWAKPVEKGTAITSPYPAFSEIKDGERRKAPSHLDLVRPHGEPVSRKEQLRAAQARWLSDPKNREKRNKQLREYRQKRKQQTQQETK